ERERRVGARFEHDRSAAMAKRGCSALEGLRVPNDVRPRVRRRRVDDERRRQAEQEKDEPEPAHCRSLRRRTGDVTLKRPNRNEACVAWTRYAAHRRVLGRADSATIDAPCVLALRSPITPTRRASFRFDLLHDQCPLTEKCTGSCGSALQRRGEIGHRRMSSPKVCGSLTSTAPNGLIRPT